MSTQYFELYDVLNNIHFYKNMYHCFYKINKSYNTATIELILEKNFNKLLHMYTHNLDTVALNIDTLKYKKLINIKNPSDYVALYIPYKLSEEFFALLDFGLSENFYVIEKIKLFLSKLST